MAGKDARQSLIQKLVHDHPASTQDQLRRQLRAEGFIVDQSTLSRDLAELGIHKARGRYVQAAQPADETHRPDYSAAVKRFTTCGPHLIVVTTEVGQAQPVALAIDAADEAAVTATLAGDDTIFVATKNRRTQVVALRRLTQWFGDKHEQ